MHTAGVEPATYSVSSWCCYHLSYVCVFYGDDGDRTHYLLNAVQALAHLSYVPGSPTQDQSRNRAIQYKGELLSMPQTWI